MTAFAYPNVDLINGHDEFIGCGRYRVSVQGPEAGETPAGPNVGNLAEILDAVEAVLSERTTNEVRISEARIYERRDKPQEQYQGNSLAHAYFLASIHRVLHVRRPFQNLEGDIWCTGAIRLGLNRAPLLTEVEQSGFDVKLQAFLSTDNRDRVFLVPKACLTAENTHLCRTPPEATLESAQTLTLSEWRALLRRPRLEGFSHKVVVGIQAHEPPLLVAVLFQSPPDQGIVEWFQALTALREQDQIADASYWEVLMYALQQPLDRTETADMLLDLLHDQPRDELKQRLYFQGAIGPDAISKTPIAVAASTPEAPWATPTLRVQQVLVAIRYRLPISRTELGLRFILIPPSTAPHGAINPEAYYLAQTPVSKADWSRMMAEGTPGGAAHGQQPQDHLSVYCITKFCDHANEHCQQQGQSITLAIPALAHWGFAVTTHAETLDFEALQGKVDQCFQRGGTEYVMCGGRYADPTRCMSAEQREPSLGFRPLLRLGGSNPRQERWG
jgi:hypothetical protein